MSKRSVFENYPKTTLLCTILLAILCLDVVFTKGLSFYKEYVRSKNSKSAIAISHPIYDHTFKPLSTWNNTFRKEAYSIYTNSLGFKDESCKTIPLSSNQHRIVFIGDSFTEGIGLKYEDTFVGMIHKSLKEKNIDVLNAGRSSYSPFIHAKKIGHFLNTEKLKFNELIVFLDLSDPQDEILYKNKYTLKKKTEEKFSSKSTQLKQFIIKNTSILHFVSNFAFDILTGKHNEETHDWSLLTNLNFTRDKWTIDKHIYESYGKEGLTLMETHMNELLSILRPHNIKLTIAVYPWPSQIWYNDLHSLQVKFWKNWSQKQNVDFINLFPEFITKNASTTKKLDTLKKYYFPGDMHFNKNGNQLIANFFLENYNQKINASLE